MPTLRVVGFGGGGEMAVFKPNRKAYRELLASEGAARLVSLKGEALAAQAGDGFETNTQLGKVRQRAIVYPETWSAIHRNRRENTLVRVLG